MGAWVLFWLKMPFFLHSPFLYFFWKSNMTCTFQGYLAVFGNRRPSEYQSCSTSRGQAGISSPNISVAVWQLCRMVAAAILDNYHTASHFPQALTTKQKIPWLRPAAD